MCQQTDRLDVVTLEQHLATVYSIIINAEFKSDSPEYTVIMLILYTSSRILDPSL